MTKVLKFPDEDTEYRFMNFTRMLILSLWVLLLANCSLEIGIEDLSGPDFLKSSVVSETVGIADGVNELVVTVELRNSDDTLVVGHTPILSLLSGDSVTLVGCTVSNDNGLSVCRLKSSIVGVKTIAFGNIKIDLTEDVVFDPPSRNGTFQQVLSAAQNNVNASGYSVTSQLGAPMQGLRDTPSSYEVFTSTTGAITPTQ